MNLARDTKRRFFNETLGLGCGMRVRTPHRFSFQPGRQAPRCFPALACGLALFFLVACATSPEEKGFTTEKLLVAAGFTYKEAQTPEQLQKLEKLPQQKLLRHELRGKPVYLYAEAAGCKCLYAGDDDAYSRFIKLHREAKLNAELHEGIWSQGDIYSSGGDWSAYVDDLGSGMIPGY